MGRKPLRRLELRLPVDHPVWDIPPGARATWVRAALDIAAKLDEISRRLDAIEGRLSGAFLERHGGPAGAEQASGGVADFFAAFG